MVKYSQNGQKNVAGGSQEEEPDEKPLLTKQMLEALQILC
jgi:hypothetical protein